MARTASRSRLGLFTRASRCSSLSEEPRLPLAFWVRPGGRLPRVALLVEPAVDEGPDQGAGRNTASEALAAQPRVDAFFEAHRHRLSQGSHLRPQPYTSRPPPANLHPPTATRNRCGGLAAMGLSSVATSKTIGKGRPFLLRARDVQVWPHLRRATYSCPGEDFRLSIVAVYGFHLFEAWVECHACVIRQPCQRAPSTRKYDPFGHEAHATYAALVFDPLQPERRHLNLRNGYSRNRARMAHARSRCMVPYTLRSRPVQYFPSSTSRLFARPAVRRAVDSTAGAHGPRSRRFVAVEERETGNLAVRSQRPSSSILAQYGCGGATAGTDAWGRGMALCSQD